MMFSKAEFWKTHAQDQLTERYKKVINRLLDEGTDLEKHIILDASMKNKNK